MFKDYSKKNLQRVSFRGANLVGARFTDSDLRGADFSSSNLRDADFTHVKTGIAPIHTFLFFFTALVISLFSGYIAMLAGNLVQRMIASKDILIRVSGIAATMLTLIFIVYTYLRGGRNAIRNLIIPVSIIALLVGILGLMTGVGTGIGMAALVAVNFLVAIMFVVGTVARVTAGALSSNILFLIVAMGGGMFGKSLGGGIGTVIMAMSCVIISKRALSGAEGFDVLRKVAFTIISKFGTSFRNARLANANFSGSIIFNTDFTNAEISSANWDDTKKINCLIGNKLFIEKKDKTNKVLND